MKTWMFSPQATGMYLRRSREGPRHPELDKMHRTALTPALVFDADSSDSSCRQIPICIGMMRQLRFPSPGSRPAPG
jgi:hypothetical protein